MVHIKTSLGRDFQAGFLKHSLKTEVFNGTGLGIKNLFFNFF
jgi:hypothetical protein